MSLQQILSQIHSQRPDLLTEQESHNPLSAHSTLAAHKHDTLQIVNRLHGTPGVTSQELERFRVWLDADATQLRLWEKQWALFVEGKRAQPVLKGSELAELLPRGSVWGSDADGNVVNPSELSFNAVVGTLSAHRMIFTDTALSHAEEVLSQLKADSQSATRYLVSKNRAEEYLYLTAYLLKRLKSQAAFMSTKEKDNYLIWESIARVDAEQADASTVISPALLSVKKQAQDYLKSLGLKSMSQLALAQRDGRVRAAAVFDGLGDAWNTRIKNLLDNPETGPLVRPLYEALIGEFLEKEYGYNFNIRALLEKNPDVDWLEVMGADVAVPASILFQILCARDLETVGFDFSRHFAVLAAQSLGEISAVAKGQAAKEPILLPTKDRIAGFSDLETLKKAIRAALSLGKEWQEASPYKEGQDYVVNISGIPSEEGENSALSKLFQIVIDGLGEESEYLYRSNMTVGAPEYFTLIGGSPKAVKVVRELISGHLQKWPADRYSADIREVVTRIQPQAKAILGGLNQTYLKDPKGARTSGVSIAPHNRRLYTASVPRFLVEMFNRGVDFDRPAVPVLSTATGEDLRQKQERSGKPYIEIIGEETSVEPVWMDRVTAELRNRGIQLVVNVGKVAGSFVRHNNPGVPVLSTVDLSGKEMAENPLKSTNPQVAQQALDANLYSDLFVDPKPAEAAPAKAPHASTKKDPVPLEKVPNIQVTPTQVAAGYTVLAVSATQALSADEAKTFKESLMAKLPPAFQRFFLAEKHENRDGGRTYAVPNQFVKLIDSPRVGWVYRLTVSPDGQVTQFRIDTQEGRQKSLVIDLEGSLFKVSVFNTAKNTKSELKRELKVELDKADDPAKPTYKDAKIIEDAKAYRKEARRAYLDNWDTGVIPNVRQTLATEATDDILSSFRLEYDYVVTKEDMVDYAIHAGYTEDQYINPENENFRQAPGYLKDRVMGHAMLASSLLEAADMDPNAIRNLGGGEKQAEDLVLKPGTSLRVEGYITSIADVPGGREMQGYVKASLAGATVNELLPKLISMRETSDKGRVNLFAPRRDLPTQFKPEDYMGDRIVYTPKEKLEVASGSIVVPENAAAIFDDDDNGLHHDDIWAILASSDEGVIMQGENYFNRVANAIVKKMSLVDSTNPADQVPLTLVDRGQYLGFINRSFKFPVRPGEKLSYSVIRIEKAEGLHHYEVVCTNEKGNEVIKFELFAKGPKTLFMFPGQGSQYEKMDEHVMADPDRAKTMQELQALVDATGHHVNLLDAMKRGSSNTAETQPMLVANQIAYIDWMRSLGLIDRDAEATGHSLGMYAALYFARILTKTGLVGAISERASKMGGLSDPNNPQGMLAISVSGGRLDEALVEKILKEVSKPSADSEELPSIVEIANKNNQAQIVVAGHKSALERLEEKLKEVEAKIQKEKDPKFSFKLDAVPVTRAFHSSLMAPGSASMVTYFDTQFKNGTSPFQPAQHRVIMDTTAEYLPDDPKELAGILAEQVSRNVNFIGAIYEALASGVRRFIEVGASNNGRGVLRTNVRVIAKLMGINLNTIEVLYAHPERSDEWAYFTGDAIQPPEAAPTPAPKEEKPAAVTAAIVANVVSVQATVPVEATASVKLSDAKPVSAAEFRKIQVTSAMTLINRRVNANDPAKAGSEPLFKAVVENVKTVKLAGLTDDVAKLLEGAGVGMGGIEVLEAYANYLRGMVREKGATLVPATVWAAGAGPAEIMDALKYVFENFQQVGDYKLASENWAMDAQLSDKGSKPLGMDSKKVPNILFAVCMVFGISLKKEADNIKTLGDLVENVLKKLKTPEALEVNVPSAVLHMSSLMAAASGKLLAKLKADKKAAEEAAALAARGGGGMSKQQMEAMEKGVLTKAEVTMNSKLQASARVQMMALAKQAGIELDEGFFEQVTISVQGEAVSIREVEARATAERLNNATIGTSQAFIDSKQPNYNPEREYRFGGVEAAGGPFNLITFVGDLKAGRLPSDPRRLTAKINRLAHQLGQSGLAQAKYFKGQLTKLESIAVMDRLIARIELVLEKGPQFDGVIELYSAEHVPDHNTGRTRVAERALTTDQLLLRYEQLGAVEQASELRELLDKGGDWRGIDVVITGSGTIGAPDIEYALSLGARVIVLDYKGRSTPQGELGFRSEFYRDLKEKCALAGLGEQLIIEPYFIQGNQVDLNTLMTHMQGKGYLPQVFLHAAGTSDYGDLAGDDDEAEIMTDMFVNFPKKFAAKWAKYYQELETAALTKMASVIGLKLEEVRELSLLLAREMAIGTRLSNLGTEELDEAGELIDQRDILIDQKKKLIAKAKIDKAALADQTPEIFDFAHRKTEEAEKITAAIVALLFRKEPVDLQDVVPFLIESLHHYTLLMELYPTPNNRNQIPGGRNYTVKEATAGGLVAETIYNDGYRYANGDPIVFSVDHRTTWTNDEQPYVPKAQREGDDKSRLMQENALISQPVERAAAERLKAQVHFTIGREIAAFTTASINRAMKEGPAARRGKGKGLIPLIHREYDATLGFGAIERAMAKKGKTVGDFLGEISNEEAAKREKGKKLYVPERTEAARLPDHGSIHDLNDLLRQTVIRDGRTTGRFAPAKTDIYPKPYTLLDVGEGLIAAGGDLPISNFMYWMALSGGQLPADMKWLQRPDYYALAKLIVDFDGATPLEDPAAEQQRLKDFVTQLSKMSYEEIADKYGKQIRAKLGAQALEEAARFEYMVPFEADSDFLLEVSDVAQAKVLEGAGYKVLLDKAGKMSVQVKAGQTVFLKAEVQGPTDVVISYPGFGQGVKWSILGLTEKRDQLGNYAQNGGKVALGAAYMSMGETAKTLNAKMPREDRNAAEVVALADALPNRNIVADALVGKEISPDGMAAQLGDGLVGQNGSEQGDRTGEQYSASGACSSTNMTKKLAADLARASYLRALERAPLSERAKIKLRTAWETGGSDYAGGWNVIFPFVAAGALYTREKQKMSDLAERQWSRAGNVDVSGFVPGIGAAEIIHETPDLARNRYWRVGYVGGGNAGNGATGTAPREAYGVGLLLAKFKEWQETRDSIPGETDREKLENVDILFDLHQTSTPLGDGYEMNVVKLFMKYAGIESIPELYDPSHPWYLGVKSYAELLDPANVMHQGIDGIDKFLEKELPKEIRSRIGAPDGKVALVSQSKVPFGHTLGAHAEVTAVLSAVMFRYRVVPGNPNLDNPRAEMAANPYLVFSSKPVLMDDVFGVEGAQKLKPVHPAVVMATAHGAGFASQVFSPFSLQHGNPGQVGSDVQQMMDAAVAGIARRKNVIRFGLAAGFSNKNTSNADVEMQREYSSEAEALESWAEIIRQEALARAQLQAFRDGKRPAVVGNYGDLFPHAEYNDLRLMYNHSRAAAAYMLHTGMPLDWDNIETWAPMMVRDPDAIISKHDEMMEEAFGRIDAVIRTEMNHPEQIEQLRQVTTEQKRSEQPYLYLGGSDGMGMRDLISHILAGAVKYAVLVHADLKDGDRDYNAKALKVWAASRGVHIEDVNESAIVFDHESFQVEGNDFPQEIDWSKVKHTQFAPAIRAAIQKVKAMAPNKNGILVDSIAMGAAERVPGAGSIEVPSIDAEGRLFMETVHETPGWNGDQGAIKRTIGPMGFQIYAEVEAAMELGFLGSGSIVRSASWKNGAAPELTASLGSYYDGNGLSGKAALGISKYVGYLATLEANRKYGHLGIAFRIIDDPFFFSAASRMIGGAWNFGLGSKQVLEERDQWLKMGELALKRDILLYESLRGDGFANGPMRIEVDGPERGSIPEVSARGAHIAAAIRKFYRDHPEKLQIDPRTGARYIPVEESRKILEPEGQPRVVPENYREILAEYVAPDEKAARAIEKGPLTTHKGSALVNPNFAASIPQFIDQVAGVEIKDKTPFSVSIPYHIPATHHGYQSIAHGGRIDSYYLSAIEALSAKAGTDLLKGRTFQVVYEKNAPVDVDVKIVAERDKAGAISLRMEDAKGEVLNRAYLHEAKTETKDDKITLEWANPAKKGEKKTLSVSNKLPIKPIELRKYPQHQFQCLGDCSAAGHTNEVGLQFKYSLDPEKNVLWGGYDPIAGRDNLHGLMLASDDLAAWVGMRSVSMWGYTSDNTYIKMSDSVPGERLFLMAQVTERGETPAFEVPVYIVNARGQLRGINVVGYFRDEKATLNGMKRHVQLLTATPNDPHIKATDAFLKDSLGTNYDLMRVTAVRQMLREGTKRIAGNVEAGHVGSGGSSQGSGTAHVSSGSSVQTTPAAGGGGGKLAEISTGEDTKKIIGYGGGSPITGLATFIGNRPPVLVGDSLVSGAKRVMMVAGTNTALQAEAVPHINASPKLREVSSERSSLFKSALKRATRNRRTARVAARRNTTAQRTQMRTRARMARARSAARSMRSGIRVSR